MNSCCVVESGYAYEPMEVVFIGKDALVGAQWAMKYIIKTSNNPTEAQLNEVKEKLKKFVSNPNDTYFFDMIPQTGRCGSCIRLTVHPISDWNDEEDPLL